MMMPARVATLESMQIFTQHLVASDAMSESSLPNNVVLKNANTIHSHTHIHFKSSLILYIYVAMCVYIFTDSVYVYIYIYMCGFFTSHTASISLKPHKTCASNIQDSLCTTQTVFVRKKVLHDPFLFGSRIFPMTHDPQLLQKLSPPATQLKSKMFHRSPGIASSSFKVDVSQSDYETTVDGKNPAPADG